MDAYVRGPELDLDDVWVKVRVVYYHELAALIERTAC